MANYHELDIQSLALKMLEGDTNAKNQIIDHYKKYIYKIVEINFKDFDCDKNAHINELIKIIYKSIDEYANIKNEYFSHYIIRKLHQYYFNELRKLKNKNEYKNREIQELIIKMKNGDMNARDKIIEFYSYHIQKMIDEKYKHINCEKEDLVQVGIIGLLKAMNHYQLQSNHSFSSYANTYIKQQIDSEINMLNSNKEYIGLTKKHNINIVDDFEHLFEIKLAMSKLSKIKQQIIYFRLFRNYSFVDIANLYNFSCQNAQLHYKRALEIIKEEFDLKNAKKL